MAYVTDSAAGSIRAIPVGGGLATTFATGLKQPWGIAFGPTGTLYVDSATTGVVYKVGPGGTSTPFVTIPLNSSYGLDDLAIDSVGNLYVSVPINSSAGTIAKVTPTGVISTYATGLGNPNGLAFDTAGDLLVGSTLGINGKIYKVGPGGGVATLFASSVQGGTFGLAVDAVGNVYASSYDNGFIEKFTAAGVDLGRYVTPGSDTYGIAFDSSGNLLVCGGDDEVVLSVTPDGKTVSTLATGFFTSRHIAVAPAVVPEPAAAGAWSAVAAGSLARRRRRFQR